MTASISVCLALRTKPECPSSWLPAPAVSMLPLFTHPEKWTSLNSSQIPMMRVPDDWLPVAHCQGWLGWCNTRL